MCMRFFMMYSFSGRFLCLVKTIAHIVSINRSDADDDVYKYLLWNGNGLLRGWYVWYTRFPCVYSSTYIYICTRWTRFERRREFWRVAVAAEILSERQKRVEKEIRVITPAAAMIKEAALKLCSFVEEIPICGGIEYAQTYLPIYLSLKSSGVRENKKATENHL